MSRGSRRGRIWPSLAFLGWLYGLAFGAGVLSPNDPNDQNRWMAFAPPTRLHVVDATGNWHLRPFVFQRELVPGTVDEYAEDPRERFPISWLSTGEPSASGSAGRRRLVSVEPPAHLYLLGTDGLGRDLFARLLHGARISLVAGLAAALLSVTLGVAAGVAAGFYRGWIDEITMRSGELLLALPALYLLLAARASLPLTVPPLQAFLLMVGILGSVGWPQTARLVRGLTLELRDRDDLLAARGFGASDLYLLRRHILPATTTVAVTQVALLTPRYILAEVTLSFLGLGIGEPTPSWGTLLASLQQYHVLVSYPWMFSPALVLAVTVLSYHRLSDALQRRWGTPAV